MTFFFELEKNHHPDFAVKRQAPRGPVVLDVNHPLYSALDEFYLAQNRRMIGLKHLKPAVPTNTTAGWGPTGGYVERSESDTLDCGDEPWMSDSGTNMSVVAHYSTTDSDHTVVARRDGGSIIQWQWYVSNALNEITWKIGSTNNVMYSGTPPAKYSDGFPHVVGVSVTGSASTLYHDGEIDGSSAASGTAGSSVNLAIGNRWETYPAAGFGMDGGKIYSVMFFNRALTDFEQKSLSDDPYQLLKPAVPMQWYLPTAAAGATNPKGPLGMPIRGPFGGPI